MIQFFICIVCVDGILPKGPYPPCLRMADRALLAGYHQCVCMCCDIVSFIDTKLHNSIAGFYFLFFFASILQPITPIPLTSQAGCQEMMQGATL